MPFDLEGIALCCLSHLLQPGSLKGQTLTVVLILPRNGDLSNNKSNNSIFHMPDTVIKNQSVLTHLILIQTYRIRTIIILILQLLFIFNLASASWEKQSKKETHSSQHSK